MRDDDCVRFLQETLPRLGLRWPGFRKVRGQVRKRIGRRLSELRLDDLEAYRERLATDPGEWRVLERTCRVTISRFWRDRETIRKLGMTVLPALASRAAGCLDVWSCGCASGEEPYSIAMLWHERLADRIPDVKIRILATDADMHLLVRAGRAVYPVGSTKEVPDDIAATALDPVGTTGNEVRVTDRDRAVVHRVQSDVRDGAPGGPFHVILCRNLVFTYFDEQLQRLVGDRLVASLHRGGALVLGGHETLPDGLHGLAPWPDVPCTFRRTA